MATILEFKNIDKRFDSVHALKNVSFSIIPGETMALVGENGAGKSTLMKILTGVYSKDAGEITIRDRKTNIVSTTSAKKLGIAQVYQQSELVPELTVAENIFLGEAGFGKNGFISWSGMYRKAQALLQKFDIPISAKARIRDLNVANQQLVSIVKVLQREPQILILDEPTAVMADREIELLFRMMEGLKKANTTIIYISHKLDEVFRVADRIAVLRDGSLITVLENRNVTKEKLIVHMLGREVNALFPEKSASVSEEVVLEVRNLSSAKVQDISFKLKRGEILGIAGLVGSGRTELARALYGLDERKSGDVLIEGKAVRIKDPVDAVRLGLFLAPEDRRGQALVLVRSIRDNISLSNLRKVSRFGWCTRKREERIAEGLKKELNIKAETIGTLTGHLSGGNQQKVVIAKALIAEPKVLIVDEPTQGIDIGAKSEIYALLEQLKRKGLSIIFISSETEELQGLCSRLLVMRRGRLAGEMASDIGNNEKILQLML